MVVEFAAFTVSRTQQAALRNLRQRDDFRITYHTGDVLRQRDGGRISAVAADDQETDSVSVLDTACQSCPPAARSVDAPTPSAGRVSNKELHPAHAGRSVVRSQRLGLPLATQRLTDPQLR